MPLNTTTPGIPTVTFTKVGVQQITLYPWNAAVGPYDVTTGCNLFGLKSLGLTKASRSATLKGGESVHTLGAWETDRETKVKIMNGKSDLRLWNIIMGGTFGLNPANGYGAEQQFFAEGLTDRAPYFRIVAVSSNGNGALKFVFPKLRIDGTVSYNLQRDQVTDIEFEAFVVFDYTYVKQDGTVGAPFEALYDDAGLTTLHS